MAEQERDPSVVTDFALERYKYLLQQIHTVNENVYKFLAIYQALVTALVTAVFALFVGYRNWGIAAYTARDGVLAVLCLVTVIAVFTCLLIVMGLFNWLDYRREECELTDQVVYPGFRKPPRIGNLFRWYETYILLFIIVSVALLWGIALGWLLPVMSGA